MAEAVQQKYEYYMEFSERFRERYESFSELPGLLDNNGFILYQDEENEMYCHINNGNYCYEGSFTEIIAFLRGFSVGKKSK